jgi:NAD(P)-dependent dehydrogenase (short-subunit alcohol dehydrogenase family)
LAANLTCSSGDPIKPEYSLSPQGIESLFATNCVGHHILVALLLPLLRSTIVQHRAPDARIIFTTSSLHVFCCELEFDLLTASTPSKSAYYDGIWRYARSKLANILYTMNSPGVLWRKQRRKVGARMEQETDQAAVFS